VKYHSKKRKKFQKYFVKLFVENQPIYELLLVCKEQLNKKLNKFSNEELLEEISDKMFANYCVAQWKEFQQFEKYVEGKK
tara:strand:+ start:218 stop:457 length:240 start_codon:yes stop_codon:yes gene_type:complete